MSNKTNLKYQPFFESVIEWTLSKFLKLYDARRKLYCIGWMLWVKWSCIYYFASTKDNFWIFRSSGLYVSWKPYISVLSRFFTCLGHTYLTAVCADKLPLIYTETKLTGDPNWSSIVPVCDLYAAWFQPTFIDAETRWLFSLFIFIFWNVFVFIWSNWIPFSRRLRLISTFIFYRKCM